jgi:DNA polymerase I-like protein with 3'-5' exonuclease and polymerase domains
LKQVVKLSMDMLDALIDIERAGIKISSEKLAKIKADYQAEYDQLYNDLMDIAEIAMGDTPINLDSPDDRSKLLYSRQVVDKTAWKEAFNIGTEQRGHTKKQKRKTKMSPTMFKETVKELAPVFRKTRGQRCEDCGGTGRKRNRLKSGELSKNYVKCKTCGGTGVVYVQLREPAGLRVIPRGPQDTAAAGFRTDKETLSEIRLELEGKAREFVDKYTRYSMIRTYLNTFVDSLEKYQDVRGFIHPNFNQCITATGRLSSSRPNFQNMPRGATFPAREAIVSRYDGGFILEGDYSQLEFRVAGYLSKDPVIYEEVKSGFDVHSYTAEIMGVSRQDAKAHTFKPLYGGVLGTNREMAYYSAFRNKYQGVTEWHDKLQEEAVTTKQVVLPSGREYAFPYAKYTRYGTTVGATSIKNYPVQGFATADLLPLALIRLHKSMKAMQKPVPKSKIINTVHDSIIMDVHPDEKDWMINLLQRSMLCIPEECKEQFGIDFDMPIEIELKIGKDWLNLEELEI